MTLKNALLINSYGGSILAAAMELGTPILGSYESSGYGLEVQRFNAPNLRYVAETKDWPKQDLSSTLVIGHPPCSAFSKQNTSMQRKNMVDPMSSLNSPAFACTKALLNYAAENNAAMIMVESVPGAMEGARQIHDDFAQKHGYSTFRIMQNATEFGLPQNRRRFWIVFSRQEVHTVHRPAEKSTTLKDVVRFDGVVFEKLSRRVAKYMAKLKTYGVTDDFITELLAGKYGTGRLHLVLGSKINDKSKAHEMMLSQFDSDIPWLLNENELAPVVQAISCWLMNGNLLTLPDFKRIMGYPDWYGYPKKIAENANTVLGYLSRGVCPPIVEWLVANFAPELAKNEAKRQRWTAGEAVTMKHGDLLEILPKGTKSNKPRSPRAPKEAEAVEVNPLAPRAVAVED